MLPVTALHPVPAAATTTAARAAPPILRKSELIRAALERWCPHELVSIVLAYVPTPPTLYALREDGADRDVRWIYRAVFTAESAPNPDAAVAAAACPPNIECWEAVARLSGRAKLWSCGIVSGADTDQLLVYDTGACEILTLTRDRQQLAAPVPPRSSFRSDISLATATDVGDARVSLQRLPQALNVRTGLYQPEGWQFTRALPLVMNGVAITRASGIDASRQYVATRDGCLFELYSDWAKPVSNGANAASAAYGGHFSVAYRYDLRSGVVTRVSSPPAPRQQFALSYDAVSHSIWVTGGTESGVEAPPDTVNLCYDIANDKWHTVAPLVRWRRNHGSCVYRRHLIVAGGLWSWQLPPLFDVEAFPLPNSASEIADVSPATKWLPAGTYPDLQFAGNAQLFVLNDRLWARVNAQPQRFGSILPRLWWLDDSSSDAPASWKEIMYHVPDLNATERAHLDVLCVL